MTTRFCRIALRATDVAAARAFYAAVLGRADADVVPLPAEAAARGAPAHWLGHLGVDDVDAAARAFVARGAVRLGPTRPDAAGETAILRDPGGAVVAVATRPATPPPTGVAWHVLNTPDPDGAAATYHALCGWHAGERRTLAGVGAYRELAWHDGGPPVGAIADTAGRPEVHPHWLFHFPVPALDAAAAAVRAAGGVVVTTVAIPNGARVAVCEDSQGAAFGLWEGEGEREA